MKTVNSTLELIFLNLFDKDAYELALPIWNWNFYCWTDEFENAAFGWYNL